MEQGFCIIILCTYPLSNSLPALFVDFVLESYALVHHRAAGRPKVRLSVVGAGTGTVLEEAPEADELRPEFTPSKGQKSFKKRGLSSVAPVAVATVCAKTLDKVRAK